MRPAPPLAPVIVLALVALAGCSQGSGTAAATSTTGPAATSTTGPAATSEGATSTPASSGPASDPSASPGASVSLLPDSALPALTGYRYSRPAGIDVIPAGIANASAVIDGFVSRLVMRGSTRAGAVEVIRARPEATAQLDDLLPDLAQSFGRVAPSAGSLGTQRVLLLDKIRGTPGGAVVFRRENTMVIASALSGLPEARRIATLYLAAA